MEIFSIQKFFDVPSIHIPFEFYTYAPKSKLKPIQLTFSVHRAERKGFPLLAQTFNQLDDQFHLHIIGNWQDDLHLLTKIILFLVF